MSQNYTPLKDDFALVFFDLDHLTDEQREILDTTFTSLRTIVNGTESGDADNHWGSTNFYVLSETGRLEIRTPYLGNRPDYISAEQFTSHYLPPSRLVGIILALVRVFKISVNVPITLPELLQSWGTLETQTVDKQEQSVVNEKAVRQHWVKISGLLNVTETEYHRRFPEVAKSEEVAGTGEAETEEKQTSNAVVRPVVGRAPAGQGEPGEEGGGEGEPRVEPTETPEQPTATQIADQRFNLAVERERLTTIALSFYCTQWGIEPTDEIRQLVRTEFLAIINEQPNLDLKSVSNRYRLLEQLTLELGRQPVFTNWLQGEYAKVDANITNDRLKEEFNKHRQTISTDTETGTTTLPPISPDLLTNPVQAGSIQLSNLLADASGGPLNPTALASLSEIIQAYAVGFGDNKVFIDGDLQQPDFASFLNSLSDEQLMRIIFAGDVSATTSKELLAAVKKHRQQIQDILLASTGEQIFSTAVTTQATSQPGAFTTLGLTEAVQRDPLGSVATNFRQIVTSSSTEVVTEATQNEHPITSSQKAALEYTKQLRKTWAMLPLEVQRQIHIAWGTKSEDIEAELLQTTDGNLSFIPYAGIDLSKMMKAARILQEQKTLLLTQLAVGENQQPQLRKDQLERLLKDVEVCLTKQEASKLRRQINEAYLAELTPEQQVAVKNQVIAQRQNVIDQWAAEQDQPPPLATAAEMQAYLAALAEEETDQLPPKILEYLTFFANQPEVTIQPEDGEMVEQKLPSESDDVVDLGQPSEGGAISEEAPEFDWGDIAPAELAGATDAYNQQLSQGNPLKRWRNRRKKINKAKVAAKALEKVAAEKAGQEAATNVAALAGGPVGWAAKAAFIAAQLRTEEGRKKLKQQIGVILGGGVVLAGALMGFLGEVGGGIFGGLGGGMMGAGVGAFVGTFIFPGVGTALGAFIGSATLGTLGAIGGKTAGAKWTARQGMGGSMGPSFHAPSLSSLSPTPTSSSPSFNSHTPQPGGIKTDNSLARQPGSSSQFNPQNASGRPTVGNATAPTAPPGSAPGTTAASAAPMTAETGIATGSVLGAAGVLTFAAAATWMPLMSIGVLMFISLYTLYTIFAAFLAPIPVGTSTSIRDGSGNQYLTLRKTVAPNQIPNIAAGQPTTVTYTVEITPKAGYTIKLLDTTDTMKSLPATPKPPEKKAIWTWTPANQPYITKDSFAPLSPEGLIAGQVKTEYSIQFTEGVDALVTNTVTIKYDVFKTTGESVVTNQTFTDYSSLRIGNPKVLCWPTTGSLTQLPFCESHSSDTHCTLHENAFDIANSTTNPLQTIYAPIDGEVRGTTSATGYGIHVSLRFNMPDGGRQAEFIFGHLSAINPSISNTAYTPINQGDPIGRMGSTGMSTGYHLHYELKNNPPSDPPLFTYRDFLTLVPEPNNGVAHKLQDYVQTCYGN